MDISLANKLQEAGFPQAGGEHYMTSESPKVPTLSELIEECVRIGFNHLSYVREEGELDENDELMPWVALAIDTYNIPDAYGRTPEEAVAKLWLALNAK